MPLGDLIALGLHVRDAIAGRALFFVNGDIDAVIALDADGIHLPELGPPVDAVRDRLGDRILVSRAVHSPEAAARAERDGTDFVQAGTVFPSTSHPGTPTIGLEGLRAICAAVTIPVVAIGAITPDNARDALETGAAGVAVIGAVFDADDPRHAASELRASLGVGAARR
jgi:thiamine-phosphate pyrophosphorylase